MAAILVVDDDVDLRSLAQIILEQSGYQVLVAADGRQALQIAQQDPDPIDLLLTDLVMPGMDGAALGRQLRLRRPAMRILYMTALAVAQLAGQEIVLKHIRLDRMCRSPSNRSLSRRSNRRCGKFWTRLQGIRWRPIPPSSSVRFLEGTRSAR